MVFDGKPVEFKHFTDFNLRVPIHIIYEAIVFVIETDIRVFVIKNRDDIDITKIGFTIIKPSDFNESDFYNDNTTGDILEYVLLDLTEGGLV